MHRFLAAVTATLLASAFMGARAQAQAATGGIAVSEDQSCAQLGAKRPGSPADAAQGDHILQRLKADGLQTSVETFHMPSYSVHDVALSAAGGASFPATTFAYGGTGDVTASIVDVGTGRPNDYAGKDAKGKIVMVKRDEAYHRT